MHGVSATSDATGPALGLVVRCKPGEKRYCVARLAGQNPGWWKYLEGTTTTPAPPILLKVAQDKKALKKIRGWRT